MKSWIRYRS